MKSQTLLSFSLFSISLMLVSACSSDDKNASTSANEAVKVQVYKAETTVPRSRVMRLTGQIQALNKAELSFRVMGNLTSLPVIEGDYVKKGQVLASVKSSDIEAMKSRVQANIREAEAMLSNAEKDLQRFESLFKSGSATQKELDDVRTGHAMAKSRVEAAHQAAKEVDASLDYAKILAPFDGLITKKFMQEGQMAAPGMPVVGIEGINQFKVVARAPESQVRFLKKGDRAVVFIESAGAELTASISQINPSSAFTGAQYELTLIPLNEHPDVKAGMFASVDIQTKSNYRSTSKEVLVPSETIVSRGDLDALFVVSNQNEALLRWVKTGKTREGMTEILSGLNQGDLVVSAAEGRLMDGARVEISHLNASRN